MSQQAIRRARPWAEAGSFLEAWQGRTRRLSLTLVRLRLPSRRRRSSSERRRCSRRGRPRGRLRCPAQARELPSAGAWPRLRLVRPPRRPPSPGRGWCRVAAPVSPSCAPSPPDLDPYDAVLTILALGASCLLPPGGPKKTQREHVRPTAVARRVQQKRGGEAYSNLPAVLHARLARGRGRALF